MTADCYQSRTIAILRPKLLSEELSVGCLDEVDIVCRNA